jgi:predicted amidohydrolase YtcJ
MRSRTIRRLWPALLACAIAPTLVDGAWGQQPDRPADVILVSGRVHTLDPDRPRAEAVAVRDGRILFVGSTAHVSALKGPATRVINLQDMTVVPGFVDGHLHLARLVETGPIDLRESETEPVETSTPLIERIEKSVQLALSYGVTGAHDVGTSLEAIDAYKSLIAAGKFPFRVNAYPRVVNSGAMLERILGAGRYQDANMRLQVRGISVSLDGALGARQAALLAPYSDDPSTVGAVRVPPEGLDPILEKSLKAGFTAAIHAIGDRANQMALDAVEKALRQVPAKDHRIRIEHAEVLQPADVPRFADLGVLVSWQWIHAPLDMPWAEKRLGSQRMPTAYAWRTVMSTGARVIGGSDEGAKTFSPFMAIHAAVTRQDAKGTPRDGGYPAQKLTREEALRSYTTDPAFAAFQEVRMGVIAPGKFADLAVISRDIMTIPVEDILRTEAMLTMVAGQIVFERPLVKPAPRRRAATAAPIAIAGM